MTLDDLSEENPAALTMDGYHDCIIGVCRSGHGEPVVAYSYQKLIDKLMEEMSYEDAVEFHEFNQVRALQYMSSAGAPVIVHEMEDWEKE